jgi:superfamily I DNA and/or RNA helicase
MFNISNHIAYNGTMVSKTPDEKSSIGEVLGSSTWINVVGAASGKWAKDEGVIAVEMLEKLFESGIEDPEVFFITPFRIVSSELRQMIRNSRIANKLLPSAWAWTNEHVGTVHTFQGKEADTVIFVLGASLDSSSGARRWAGGAPNLLNVAMTRAKRRLYVVGSHKAWKNAGYFQFLATSLPVVEHKVSND